MPCSNAMSRQFDGNQTTNHANNWSRGDHRFLPCNPCITGVDFAALFILQGDQVDEFQPLCEVQSDKATIEITSRFKGKVHQIHFGPGDIVKVVIRLLLSILPL